MVLRHIVGDAANHALFPRRAAGDQQELMRWSAKDRMRTGRDNAWTPVTDRCLRALLGRLTHNKTGDVPSVMYFYNGIPYIFRHSVIIDCFYSNNNGATAVALLLDDATARLPSPDAPIVTLGDMPRAMVVRPHTFGIPMHGVCHDLPDGHVAVMPTTVCFTLRFPAAFRLESGSIVKSIQIERVGFNMIPDIALMPSWTSSRKAQLSRETRHSCWTYARRTPAPKTFRAWASL
jgi:hypothetical protein